MGDDEEEKYLGVDEMFNKQGFSDESIPQTDPIFEISKKKYLSLLKPWNGALTINLLDKSVTYRIIQQR